MDKRSIRMALAVTTVIALAGALLLSSSASARQGGESTWIVVLESGLSPGAESGRLAAAAGGSVGFVYDEVLGGFSFRGSDAGAAALQRNPNVAAVVPSGTASIADVAGYGFFRIDTGEAHSPGGFTGAGVRIAVIDTGIDLDHPDLAPNLDVANSVNCVDPQGSADDDHSHGTHVAGVAAAAYGPTDSSLVGIAPSATLVAVKSFDSSGYGSTEEVLCGVNHVAALVTADAIPTVANMSFTEPGANSVCDDADVTDVMHEAICDLTDLGVVSVAAAGNDGKAAADQMPAAFDEVITTSAITDFDGQPGGAAGCRFGLDYGYECDDTFAGFSNDGPEIDVTAPGVYVYSTLPGGGHGTKSGTSMAAPHVSGVAALVLGANPALAPAEVEAILQSTGECPSPSGVENAGSGLCSGQGSWPDDRDGSTEPLVNAARAAQAAAGVTEPPTNDPPPVAEFSFACTDLECDFTDESTDDGTLTWDWTFEGGGTSTAQHPTHTFPGTGTYNVTLTVTDTADQTDSVTHAVTVTANDPPPVAEFSFACTNLECDFTDESTDDGTLTWDWAFEGGGSSTAQNPTHTFPGAGTYDVTLTVTDTADQTDSITYAVTVTSTEPPPSGLTLSVTGTKTKGNRVAELTWSGAGSDTVDIYRDGAPLTSTDNDGSYADPLGKGKAQSVTYQVCESGGTCSEVVPVTA